MLYFLVWGVLYGIIRLRTGSILGVVLVQALASFTAWYVFQPPADMTTTGLANGPPRGLGPLRHHHLASLAETRKRLSRLIDASS